MYDGIDTVLIFNRDLLHFVLESIIIKCMQVHLCIHDTVSIKQMFVFSFAFSLFLPPPPPHSSILYFSLSLSRSLSRSPSQR